MCIASFNTSNIERNYIQITFMSTLVNQLTIEDTYNEYNSLVDKIVAKYQKLDSSEFGNRIKPLLRKHTSKGFFKESHNSKN